MLGVLSKSQGIAGKKMTSQTQDHLFLVCVGHDTDLVGSNPTAGIYRQAKRTTSRCQ